MALSGLEIYKLLAKTNCRECGFSTCLAFAMALAKKQVDLDKCPYIKEEVKAILESASLPPIRLVTLGFGEDKVDIGKEVVMFRHEEKFYNPTAIGFIIDDNISEGDFERNIKTINKFNFERVGELLKVNLIAIRQNGDATNFINKIKKTLSISKLPLVLMSSDVTAISGALDICAKNKPLIYAATDSNIGEMISLAKKYQVALTIKADLEKVEELTQKADKEGLSDLVIDTGKKPIAKKLEDLALIRRLSLKKKRRSVGYPVLCVVEHNDAFSEVMEAGAFIAKYSSIVLIKTMEAWNALSLLTLRQNIYTDPQKPLQVEPKVYNIGQVDENSPVMVTTNFSLTYYTVLGEVEASKVPSYIVSVDTEGMSVLTAWAAEKFTPEKIASTLDKLELKKIVKHNNVIIPGYVSVLSGDLEDQSGWKVLVGPKEAAGLPSFLKKL